MTNQTTNRHRGASQRIHQRRGGENQKPKPKIQHRRVTKRNLRRRGERNPNRKSILLSTIHCRVSRRILRKRGGGNRNRNLLLPKNQQVTMMTVSARKIYCQYLPWQARNQDALQLSRKREIRLVWLPLFRKRETQSLPSFPRRLPKRRLRQSPISLPQSQQNQLRKMTEKGTILLLQKMKRYLPSPIQKLPRKRKELVNRVMMQRDSAKQLGEPRGWIVTPNQRLQKRKKKLWTRAVTRMNQSRQLKKSRTRAPRQARMLQMKKIQGTIRIPTRMMIPL
mmetsp:Transcript_14504/g.36440  ORF Transcript_14504/g.36440 Transcript_14504/m.36440 type:complete len:280 (+) Transcript_14504:111-950(+)